MNGYADIIRKHTRKIWDKKDPHIQMEKMKKIIQEKYVVSFSTDRDFHKWSVLNYAQFWEEMWNFYGVIHSKPYTQVARRIGERIVDIEWFSGARLNYAENILRYRDDHLALLCPNEAGEEERITFAEMYEEVRLYAAAFRKNGLTTGDRVASYISNRKEAIFAMLAVTSIGAVFGGPLVFYGAKEASSYLKAMNPKMLITVDSFYKNGKEVNNLENLTVIMNDNDEIEKIIVVTTRKNSNQNIVNRTDKCCSLKDFLDSGRNADGTIPDLEFEQLPFNIPAFFIFTSGSTGFPKALIHSGGSFLTRFRDLDLQWNIRRGDIILQQESAGWSTWNCLVSSLGLGVTLQLHESTCFYVSHRFWDTVDKQKISYIFLVPSQLEMLAKNSTVPRSDISLDHLKCIFLLGIPAKLQHIDYILNKVKSEIFIGNLYGQSELMGAISGFYLNSPLYSTEIQCPSLGVNVQVLDPKGNDLIGKPGDLVITNPTPNLPVNLWGDPDGQRFQNTYLTKFPGAWALHDEGYIDPDTNGIIVIGRSDNVICQGDVRFNSGEIYWAIDDIEEIQDSICVSLNNIIGDVQGVLFVLMKKGHVFNKDIVVKIRNIIGNKLTYCHVPKMILPVEDIPYNLNGKKMERIVRETVQTNQVPYIGNIRNSECLLKYCNIPEILSFLNPEESQ